MKRGWCVWITGLPGSGKSVISRALIQLLEKQNISVQLISSDSLRTILTPEPSYSLRERDFVYNTIVYVADLLTKNNVNVIIDATANLRRYRKKVREIIPTFIEVYLKCPIEVCMKRESKRKKTYDAPKEIYRNALRGSAINVPGVGQPYEPPHNPEVEIDTVQTSVDQSAEKIMRTIKAISK